MIESTIDVSRLDLDLGDVLQPIPAVAKLLSHWVDRNNRAVEAAWENTLEEWVIEDRRQMAGVLRLLVTSSTETARLSRKVEELVEDPAFARVRDNYGYEACREAIDERRRMLAYAGAGSVDAAARNDLSIGQLARVERTLRELDPQDLVNLKKLADIANPPFPHVPSDVEHLRSSFTLEWEENCMQTAVSRRSRWINMEPSTGVLLSSGCVYQTTGRLNATIANGVIVAPIGHWVLAVMDPYLRAIAGAENV